MFYEATENGAVNNFFEGIKRARPVGLLFARSSITFCGDCTTRRWPTRVWVRLYAARTADGSIGRPALDSCLPFGAPRGLRGSADCCKPPLSGVRGSRESRRPVLLRLQTDSVGCSTAGCRQTRAQRSHFSQQFGRWWHMFILHRRRLQVRPICRNCKLFPTQIYDTFWIVTDFRTEKEVSHLITLFTFLPRDAVLARYRPWAYATGRCSSVRHKPVKATVYRPIFAQPTLHGSQEIPAFWYQRFWWISNEVTITRDTRYTRGVGKICGF